MVLKENVRSSMIDIINLSYVLYFYAASLECYIAVRTRTLIWRIRPTRPSQLNQNSVFFGVSVELTEPPLGEDVGVLWTVSPLSFDGCSIFTFTGSHLLPMIAPNTQKTVLLENVLS
ncbi:hypothetical protein SOVF_165460 [Spinacia oleracea]|nr:hypothetical protein SOVF_165460 [Spinacia oleracea]